MIGEGKYALVGKELLLERLRNVNLAVCSPSSGRENGHFYVQANENQ